MALIWLENRGIDGAKCQKFLYFEELRWEQQEQKIKKFDRHQLPQQ